MHPTFLSDWEFPVESLRIGTPHYMAPEVMRGHGYGTEVPCFFGVLEGEELQLSLGLQPENKLNKLKYIYMVFYGLNDVKYG